MIYIQSMHGIGDNIYQRPYVKELILKHRKVYIETPLPQLYEDYRDNYGLRITKPSVLPYRTQRKNVLGHDFNWDKKPPKKSIDQFLDPHYKGEDLLKHSVFEALRLRFDVDWTPDTGFDLPRFEEPPKKYTDTDKPIAIIRPVTVRNEWPVVSRGPKQLYISWCTRILKQSGFHTISIADLERGEERLYGKTEPAHVNLHNGELSITQTMELIRKASFVVGGSGWIVPACQALKVPLFLLFGGRGAYDAPAKILDPRCDLSNIYWAMPDRFCRCSQNEHNCNKEIVNLDGKFMDFLREMKQRGFY